MHTTLYLNADFLRAGFGGDVVPVVASLHWGSNLGLKESKVLGLQLSLNGHVNAHALIDRVWVGGTDGLGVRAADGDDGVGGITPKHNMVGINRRANDGLLLTLALEGIHSENEGLMHVRSTT